MNVTTQTLSFSPDVISATIPITVTGDDEDEPDEFFYVDLSNASSNATIGDARGVGTIYDDDYVILEITKSASATVRAGDLLTYTIVVSNTGNASAMGVVVSDTIPTNTEFASAPGGTEATGVVTWSVPSLNAGASLTRTLVVTASDTLANGTIITNTTYGVTCTRGISATGAWVTTTVQAPVLAITKSAGATVRAGDLLTYTIVVSNTGNAPATGVIVSDTLTNGDTITNTTYGVTCAEGISAMGVPVTTNVQGSVAGLAPQFWPRDWPFPDFALARVAPAVMPSASPLSSARRTAWPRVHSPPGKPPAQVIGAQLGHVE